LDSIEHVLGADIEDFVILECTVFMGQQGVMDWDTGMWAGCLWDSYDTST